MVLNFDEIREYIKSCSEKTKFYIGCDSQRIRKRKKGKKVARYMISVIAHIDGKHGGRVFGGVSYHEIIDGNLGKPFNRLFKEAEQVVSTYEELYDVLMDKDVELHIDISPNKENGSHIAHNAAVVNENKAAIQQNSEKIDSVQNESRKGIAGVGAMANLHYSDMDKGDLSVAAGYANFKGENAIAIGVGAQVSDNLMMSVDASGTAGSDSEFMFGAGASYKFTGVFN